MIDTIISSMITPVTIYFSIGLTLMFVLLLLIGFNGQDWKPRNLWIIITWPIELTVLIGGLISMLVSHKKESTDENKK